MSSRVLAKVASTRCACLMRSSGSAIGPGEYKVNLRQISEQSEKAGPFTCAPSGKLTNEAYEDR